MYPAATDRSEAARRAWINTLVTWNAKKPSSQRMKRTTATVNIFYLALSIPEGAGRLSRPEGNPGRTGGRIDDAHG
jgi:hypothetical protein